MEVPDNGDAAEVYVCADCGDDYVAKRVAELTKGGRGLICHKTRSN
jgi:DNA-directed RNA polymerase subunit RPC12/RpoP